MTSLLLGKEPWLREAQSSSSKGSLDALEARIKAGDLEALIPWVLQVGRLFGSTRDQVRVNYHIWNLWNRVHPEWTVTKLIRPSTTSMSMGPLPKGLQDTEQELQNVKSRMGYLFVDLRDLALLLQGLEGKSIINFSSEDWADHAKHPTLLTKAWAELETLLPKAQSLTEQVQRLLAQERTPRR